MVTVGDAMQAELFEYVKWNSGETTDENGDPIPEPIPTQFPEIAQISQATVDVLYNIHDSGALERLFKSWSAAGRIYKMWSCYSDKPAEAPTVRQDFDNLIAAYPQDFSISGAWRYSDGVEVGAGGAGVWYPIPQQYINFMPDIMTDPGDPDADPPVPPTFAPASAPTDVNLLFGQAPRDFSSFYA